MTEEKKNEILYNATSLVSTWLYEAKDISDLRLKFSSQAKEKIVPCSFTNCGEKLAQTLIKNSEGYTKAELLGKTLGQNKLFGTLTIKI